MTQKGGRSQLIDSAESLLMHLEIRMHPYASLLDSFIHRPVSLLCDTQLITFRLVGKLGSLGDMNGVSQVAQRAKPLRKRKVDYSFLV